MVAVFKHEVELPLSFEDLQQVHQVAMLELLQEEGEGRREGGEEVERGEVSVCYLITRANCHVKCRMQG